MFLIPLGVENAKIMDSKRKLIFIIFVKIYILGKFSKLVWVLMFYAQIKPHFRKLAPKKKI